MRHVRQEFAFGTTGHFGRLRRNTQLFGALTNALFQQFLMKLDLFVRLRQRGDHAVKAIA